jgi:hypothetical protein
MNAPDNIRYIYSPPGLCCRNVIGGYIIVNLVYVQGIFKEIYTSTFGGGFAAHILPRVELRIVRF